MPQAVYLEKKESTLYKFCLWTMVKHVKRRNTFKKYTVPVTQIDASSSFEELKLVYKKRGSVRNSK